MKVTPGVCVGHIYLIRSDVWFREIVSSLAYTSTDRALLPQAPDCLSVTGPVDWASALPPPPRGDMRPQFEGINPVHIPERSDCMPFFEFSL